MFADALTDQIARFIAGLGLPIRPASLAMPSLLPGVAVRRGAILVDELRLAHPGDLLHEAGHLAVCDPAVRPALETVSEDGGEEMAAIAWSYAAARRLGIDPAIVFHAAGYGDGGAYLVEAFSSGAMIGQPMLEWFGMTLSPKAAAARGLEPYPHMLRWLR
jgi:hypothetical protein